MDNKLTVSEFCDRAKRLIATSDLKNFEVEGEVSNFKRSGGNVYFSLLDIGETKESGANKAALLRCVIWKNRSAAKVPIANGDRVIVSGDPSIYTSQSFFQLQVTKIRAVGAGVNYEAIMKLKQELKAKGFHRPENKKPIPAMPDRIGVVTSLQGAVRHDIVKTMRNRCGLQDVIFCDCKVQGSDCPKTVMRALAYMDKLNLDVIIIARGGGSDEDLVGYSDRTLCYFVTTLSTPTISAIGHDEHEPCLDIVCDARAATPTAAAEAVSPVLSDLIVQVQKEGQNLDRQIQILLAGLRQEWDSCGDYLSLHSPHRRIQQKKQSLAQSIRALEYWVYQDIRARRQKMDMMAHLLQSFSPKAQMRQADERISRAEKELNAAWTRRGQQFQQKLIQQRYRLVALRPEMRLFSNVLREKKQVLEQIFQNVMQNHQMRLAYVYERLKAKDPTRILEQGYQKVTRPDGSPVLSVREVQIGDAVQIYFYDGTVDAGVENITIKES